MDPISIIGLIVSLLILAACGGGGLLFFVVLVVGVILLRRRGQKVTVKEAVSVGAESVSQVFMKTQGGLSPMDEDDDDPHSEIG